MPHKILLFICFLVVDNSVLAQKRQQNQLSNRAIQELGRVINYEWNDADNRDAFRSILFNNMRLAGMGQLESVLEVLQSVNSSKKSRDLVLYALKNSANQYNVPLLTLLESWGMTIHSASEIDNYVNQLPKVISENIYKERNISQANDKMISGQHQRSEFYIHYTLNCISGPYLKRKDSILIRLLDPQHLHSTDTLKNAYIGSIMIEDCESGKLLQKLYLKFDHEDDNDKGATVVYDIVGTNLETGTVTVFYLAGLELKDDGIEITVFQPNRKDVNSRKIKYVGFGGLI
jgi:hypothetical protein